MTVSFAKRTIVSGLTYLPHGMRGVIGRFVVRLSSDGTHFGRAVAFGRWQANLNLKRVGWVPQDVRAVQWLTIDAAKYQIKLRRWALHFPNS